MTVRFALLSLCLASNAWAFNEGLGEPPPGLVRETPRATVRGYLDSVHRGAYAQAAHYLYLEHLPAAEQASEGPRIARRLRFVLDRALFLELETLSQEPEGDAPKTRHVLLGTLTVDGKAQPVRLQRVWANGTANWVFSEDTVRAVARWYEVFGPPLGDRLPDWLFDRTAFGLQLWQWLGLALVLFGGTLLAWVLERSITWVGVRATRLTRAAWDDHLVVAASGPLRLFFWALFFASGTASLLLPPSLHRTLQVVARSLSVAALVWACLRITQVGARYLEGRVAVDALDARSKSLRTQFAVMRRVVDAVIWVVGAALVFMQFEVVRNVGVSLLASAGIAGVVLGLAAQKSIGSLLAGIQLSVTQPIRIGDNVVVEGSFGTVEEIRLTYVVVRTWDLRRQVIPIGYFLEKPFENWTLTATDVLGEVRFEVDYLADVKVFREHLRDIVEGEGKPLWDGKTQVLQVVDALNGVITLRALVGAPDSSKCWDLRCLVRERMLALLTSHPHWVPTRRMENRTPSGLPSAPGP